MSRHPNRVYFSPGDHCLQAILACIRRARHTLQICVFTISDDRITAAILRAFAAGIQVRILTDNEKLFDKGADIRQLAAAGIPVRVDITSNHMHHKFAIVDHQTALTGSYNWTRSAALYNHENVLVTHDCDTVQAYSREFDRLWKEMEDFSSVY